MRNKAKATEILANQKAAQTLTDAIRARKAMTEANNLRDEKKFKNDVKSILNSIIDSVPVVSKIKQK